MEDHLTSISETELLQLLRDLIGEFPALPSLHPVGASNPDNPAYLRRLAFDVSLVLRWRGPDISIVDIGGGLGLFSLALAALGARSIIADDFPNEHRDQLFAMFSRHGVEVVDRDVIAEGLDFPEGSIDVATNFHFMEHVHNSPKPLFRSISRALKPDGGLFVLAGPNAVNLRKRITAPLGRYKWSTMDHWYEAETFHGHVREPDISDLRYIARDLGLRELGVYGRNFLGQGHTDIRGRVASAASPLLERRPSLCSDIYIVAERTGAPSV
jgi:SAM-dependent methyltransferase